MIQTKITKDIYHGDGTTRRFEVTFDYNTKNNVKQIDLYTCTYTTVEGVTKYNNDVNKLTSNYDFEVVDGVTYAVYPSDSAVSDGATPMAAGTAIIIMRNTPNEQLSTGQYTSEKVEKQLDRITMVAQELQEQINRCPKAPKYAESISEADFTTVAQSIDSVNNVSDNISYVNTVATNIEDVNEVNNNIQSINTVSANISDVSAVASNSTNIDIVSNNISNINTAATNMSSIIAAPTAAQNASTSATNAQKWAEGTDSDVQPLGGTHSGKGWAGQSEIYATQAASILSSCADKSLSNLTPTGEAKFNGKADTDLSNVTKTSGLRKLLEVSSQNILPSWYKLFAEYDPSTSTFLGIWCEQGGKLSSVTDGTNQSVTFLIPFINLHYYCSANVLGTDGNDNFANGVKINALTYTGMFIRNNSDATADILWKAEGYAV